MHRLRRMFRLYFHRFFLILSLGVLVTVFVIGSRIDLVSTRGSNEAYSSAVEQDKDDVVKMQIGLFINNLHGVDHSLSTFSADGQIWGTWDDASQDRWKELIAGQEVDKDLPISFDAASIHSPNALSEGDQSFVKKSIDPLSYPGGRYWQSGYFSSKFKMHQVDYRKFPFESIYLPIEVQTLFPIQRLVLTTDQRDSLVSDRVSLSGYRFVALKMKDMFYQAKTFWGHDMPDYWMGDDLTYSHLQWELHFRRAVGPAFIRLFLPLASAMSAVIFSLLVSFKVSTQKIGIPASILLVLAVLQDRWHGSLPPGLKYLTYMDELFIFAYLATMVALLHSAYCVNRCYGASETIQAEIAVRMRHDQRLLASFISAALLIAPFVLWFV